MKSHLLKKSIYLHTVFTEEAWYLSFMLCFVFQLYEISIDVKPDRLPEIIMYKILLIVDCVRFSGINYSESESDVYVFCLCV